MGNICRFWVKVMHLWQTGEPPTKFSKSGGLTGPQLLEGVAGKEGVSENKLKSEIFNDKKSL